MFVSVIVCTHSLDNFQNLKDAVDSLLNQTHREREIVIVVDGNQELYEEIVKAYGDQDGVEAVAIKDNIGLSGARNAGIRVAHGDVITFFDDDAVAEKRWLENLVNYPRQKNRSRKYAPLYVCRGKPRILRSYPEVTPQADLEASAIGDPGYDSYHRLRYVLHRFTNCGKATLPFFQSKPQRHRWTFPHAA